MNDEDFIKKVLADAEEDRVNDSEPIHTWFELSYAQYLTVPRSVLQSMPVEWQRQFVQCLEELDETIDWRPTDGQYWCQLKDSRGRNISDDFQDYKRGRRRIPTKTAIPPCFACGAKADVANADIENPSKIVVCCSDFKCRESHNGWYSVERWKAEWQDSRPCTTPNGRTDCHGDYVWMGEPKDENGFSTTYCSFCYKVVE